MSHETDQKTQTAFEHTAKMHHQEREEAKADAEVNAASLRGDSHTGQEGMLRTDKALIEGTDLKVLYTMLPEWHKDELRRLLVVAPGTRLMQGDVFCDLRFRERGELVAHGEEEVHEELLVPKKAVDYEIWNKLLNKPTQTG